MNLTEIEVRQRYRYRGKDTIGDLVKRGKFPPPMWVGRKRLWPVEVLDAFDAAQLRRASAPAAQLGLAQAATGGAAPPAPPRTTPAAPGAEEGGRP